MLAITYSETREIGLCTKAGHYLLLCYELLTLELPFSLWILPRKPLADVRVFWKYHVTVQSCTEQLPDCSKLYVFCAKETNHSATGSVKTSSLTPALWSTVHTASQYVHFSKKRYFRREKIMRGK